MNKTTEALKLADVIISRYRNETPIGNQPHMICHIADEALAAIREALAEPVTISCDCGDMYERNSFGGKFIQQYGCCPNCDAAEPVKQEHSEQYWLHEINNARAEGYEKGRASCKHDERMLELGVPVQPVKQEPVGYAAQSVIDWLVSDERTDAAYSGINLYKNPTGNSTIPLYAAPVDAKAIRAEALKEAEEIAKTIGGSFADEFLAAIRGLK